MLHGSVTWMGVVSSAIETFYHSPGKRQVEDSTGKLDATLRKVLVRREKGVAETVGQRVIATQEVALALEKKREKAGDRVMSLNAEKVLGSKRCGNHNKGDFAKSKENGVKEKRMKKVKAKRYPRLDLRRGGTGK